VIAIAGLVSLALMVGSASADDTAVRVRIPDPVARPAVDVNVVMVIRVPGPEDAVASALVEPSLSGRFHW